MGGGEKFILSILPIYFFVICAAHIGGCVWYYMALNSTKPNTWLYRYGYEAESLGDQYLASLYYIYTTLTTTGYGDIVPDTDTEFFLTILAMASGVTFHSMIYTLMLAKFEDLNERHEFFNEKKFILKQFEKVKGY